MEIRRIIISTENVKPSSPTPHHLQTYRLSMLDQAMPPMIRFPILLYFQSQISHETTQSLKRSLSVILTRFYPFAGKVSADGQSIVCDDGGVPFVVAKFPGQSLSDILTNLDPDLPHRYFLPCDVSLSSDESNLLQVQVNHFEHGGVAIAAVFSHKIADAVTMIGFLKAWGEAYRRSGQPVCPNYIAQSLFPHKNNLSNGFRGFTSPGRSVLRHYILDAVAVKSLKSEAGDVVDRPTRVEAVVALIWKHFIAAAGVNGEKKCTAAHSVNIRRKMEPPLPSDCVGNLVWPVKATAETETWNGIGVLARQTREIFKVVDSEFVGRMIGDDGLAGFHENLNRTVAAPGSGDGGVRVFFTSWCGLGIYSPDFGWGKPIWVSKCDRGSESESSNLVWLVDTRSGDGVEVCVVLDVKYVSVFDESEELAVHATPLGIGTSSS